MSTAVDKVPRPKFRQCRYCQRALLIQNEHCESPNCNWCEQCVTRIREQNNG